MAKYGSYGRPGRDGLMQSPSGAESMNAEKSVSKYTGVQNEENPRPRNAFDNLAEAREGNTSPREDEMAENTYANLPSYEDKSGMCGPLDDTSYAFKKRKV